MSNNWRTVQIFLEPTTFKIHEVEISQESPDNVRCTCRAFSSGNCKHSKFVKDSMKKNGGHYAVQIPREIPDNEVIEAMEDAESFRKFIINYAKIEVIY
jgi:hypothetical protein